MSDDDDEERGTYYAIVQVELEDVTADQARAFWQGLEQQTIEVNDLWATVTQVKPQRQ